MYISGDGYLKLLGAEGEEDDAKVPDTEIGHKIKQMVDEEKIVVVTIFTTMGIDMAVDRRLLRKTGSWRPETACWDVHLVEEDPIYYQSGPQLVNFFYHTPSGAPNSLLILRRNRYGLLEYGYGEENSLRYQSVSRYGGVFLSCSGESFEHVLFSSSRAHKN